MLVARQSTARTVTVGPVLDADGVAVTGGVVGDFKISKNGGAPAALDGSATATHRHTGFYSLALTASDLDTVGTAEVTIDDTVNSMALKEISVVEEAVYDALFAASANAFTGAAGASQLTSLASGAITEASFATTAGSFIPLGIVDQGTAQAATATTIQLRSAAAFADDELNNCVVYVKSTDQPRWQAGRLITDYVSATDTATIDPAWPTTPTGTISYIVAVGAADLTTPPAVNLTQWLGVAPNALASGRVDGTVGAMQANVITAAAAASDFGAELADAVLDEALSGHTTAGTLGKAVADVLDDTGTSGVVVAAGSKTGYSLSGSQTFNMTGTITGNLTGSVGSVAGNVDGSVNSVATAVSVSNTGAIADAVWDEALAGHVAAGSTGEALNAAGGAGDPWITSLPGSYTAGQAGYILGTNLNATVSSRASQTTADAVVADTNELQTDWANGGRLDLILDARASQTSVDAVAADLPQRVTKNVALAGFPFKLVSSSDHVTAVTGAAVTATRSLDGAAFAACANSASEVASGWYKIDLAAGDLNGNTVVLRFTATGADPREYVIVTQPT